MINTGREDIIILKMHLQIDYVQNEGYLITRVRFKQSTPEHRKMKRNGLYPSNMT